MPHNFHRTVRLVLAGACMTVAFAACENLGIRAEPEEITVEIEATGTSDVTLVTSTNWVFLNDPGCDPSTTQCDQILRVQSADTSTVTSPYRRTFRFDQRYRYLVEAYPTAPVDATLAMRILIDGQSWYSDARALAPPDANGERETLLFTYVWNEPSPGIP